MLLDHVVLHSCCRILFLASHFQDSEVGRVCVVYNTEHMVQCAIQQVFGRGTRVTDLVSHSVENLAAAAAAAARCFALGLDGLDARLHNQQHYRLLVHGTVRAC